MMTIICFELKYNITSFEFDIVYFLGSYTKARIGEVLASDADIGLNSEVICILILLTLIRLK